MKITNNSNYFIQKLNQKNRISKPMKSMGKKAKYQYYK